MIFLPAFGLMIWTIIAAMYFIPSAVAMVRHKQNVIAIFALNLLLGWTIIGWVAALVWALTKEEPPNPIVVQATVLQPAGTGTCPMCGAVASRRASFCTSCGNKIMLRSSDFRP